MTPITVLIVEDHPLMRDGLRAALGAETDIRVIGEAECAAQGVTLFREFQPDVVLLDLRLPDFHGSEAIRQILDESARALIIVLTSSEGDAEIQRALQAGARGYLFKTMVRRELIKAIRTVHAGQRYIPAEVGVRLAEGLWRSALSARELEVLTLMATGLRNKEIAGQLNISEQTVQSHIKRIFEKLEVSDRTQAVTKALRHGIIEL